MKCASVAIVSVVAATDALVDHYPAWRSLQIESPETFQKAVADGSHRRSDASVGRTWPAVETLLEQARAAAASATP